MYRGIQFRWRWKLIISRAVISLSCLTFSLLIKLWSSDSKKNPDLLINLSIHCKLNIISICSNTEVTHWMDMKASYSRKSYRNRVYRVWVGIIVLQVHYVQSAAAYWSQDREQRGRAEWGVGVAPADQSESSEDRGWRQDELLEARAHTRRTLTLKTPHKTQTQTLTLTSQHNSRYNNIDLHFNTSRCK